MPFKLQPTEDMDGSEGDTWGLPSLPTVVFLSGHLWAMSISPKNSFLVSIMTVNIETNRTAE
jgi:hypothetical protein